MFIEIRRVKCSLKDSCDGRTVEGACTRDLQIKVMQERKTLVFITATYLQTLMYNYIEKTPHSAMYSQKYTHRVHTISSDNHQNMQTCKLENAREIELHYTVTVSSMKKETSGITKCIPRTSPSRKL